jgi:hypothetical protein
VFRGAGEIEQMQAFGVVELQGPGDRVEDVFGDAAVFAIFGNLTSGPIINRFGPGCRLSPGSC